MSESEKLASEKGLLRVKAPPPVKQKQPAWEEAKTEGGDLVDGCIVLGKPETPADQYVTRYRINHAHHRKGVCRGVILEDYVPCLQPLDGRHPVTKAVECRKRSWLFIRSEIFLITLHLTALALGVAKESLNLREVDEDLHFLHSIIETFVTCLEVVIQVVSGWERFRSLKSVVFEVEHVDDIDAVRGRALRRWLYWLTGTGIFLVLTAVTCFLAFYYLVHLGWTILSNNFCLVMITVTSNLFLTRVNQTIAKIREDQHKAVMYETLLLLSEQDSASSKEEGDEYLRKRQRFTKALKQTELFMQPSHITLGQDNQAPGNTITNMEMQSFV